MTWFDALLITLLGMLGALGMRHGPGGLVLGGLCLGGAYLTNRWGAALGTAGTLALALALGAAAAALAQLVQRRTLHPYRSPPPWSSAAGLLGGAALGMSVAAAFALAFPLSPRVDAGGVHYVYPSPEMAPPLYQAVNRSLLKTSLMPLWEQKTGWQTMLLPDLPALRHVQPPAPGRRP